MAELLLTVDQTAKRLQLHPVSVRRQLQSGRLRGIKRGKLWRIPESALTETTPENPQNPTNKEIQRRLAALEAIGQDLPQNRAKPLDLSGSRGEVYGFNQNKMIEPDPVIEAYKKDVDRTLLVENLRRSVSQRVQNLLAMQRFVESVRHNRTQLTP